MPIQSWGLMGWTNIQLYVNVYLIIYNACLWYYNCITTKFLREEVPSQRDKTINISLLFLLPNNNYSPNQPGYSKNIRTKSNITNISISCVHFRLHYLGMWLLNFVKNNRTFKNNTLENCRMWLFNRTFYIRTFALPVW